MAVPSTSSIRMKDVGKMQPWYKNKKGFILLTVAIALLTFFIVTGVIFHFQKPETNKPTSFTCRYDSSNETFAVAVEIDLTDGMNQDEAVKVATEVFKVSVGGQYELRTVTADEQGLWTVEFGWGYPGESLGHWFEGVINPFDRTVTYNRCR